MLTFESAKNKEPSNQQQQKKSNVNRTQNRRQEHDWRFAYYKRRMRASWLPYWWKLRVSDPRRF